MTLLILTALIFFIAAALLGGYLLSFVMFNKETPKGIAFIHGPLAAIGLVLLIVATVLYTPRPWVSLIIFLLAAGGGGILILRDITGKSLPKWLALIHGVAAITGIILLFIFYVQ